MERLEINHIDDPVSRLLFCEAAARAQSVSPLRWRDESDAAAVCARYLVCHPRVAWVRYPGLPGDPCYSLAATTLQRGFGPYLVFALRDGSLHWLTARSHDPLTLVESLETALVRF